MKLLSKKKFTVLILILFILFIFGDFISKLLFQPNSEFLMGTLRYVNIRFAYMNGLSFFIIPLFLIVGYEYNQIKNKYLKFYIGKSNNYTQSLLKLKVKFAVSIVIILALIYCFSFIPALFTKATIREFYNGSEFEVNSILYTIFNSNLGYWLFTILTVSIGVFITLLFYMTFMDYFNYIKTTIFFIVILIICSILIYNSPWRELAPLNTILLTSSAGDIGLLTFIKPYCLYFLTTITLLASKKYEVL